VSCGSAFFFVPIVSRAEVDKAVVDARALEAVFRNAGLTPARGVFIFSPEPGPDGATCYSRMLGATSEDAATGSASGPLGCYLVRHGLVPPGKASAIVSAQGVKMGRPSRIHIKIDLSGDEITRVRVGGTSVLVGEGRLRAF
jgi:trans-2,3-dihydro-3-hydroxyanthranilate isomerase